MKKIYKLLIIVLAILLITTISLFSIASIKEQTVGEFIADIFNTKKSDVLILVDGEEIKLNTFEAAKAFNPKMNDDEIIDYLIKNQLRKNEAKESGIVVSQDEIDKIISEQKLLFLKANPDDETVKFFYDYFEGLGLTFDEYWELPGVRSGYENLLLMNKLMDKVYNEYPGEMTQEQKVKISNDYMDSLREKADIDINKSALKK